MTINFIDNIDSSRDDWNILVRIARKWDVYNMQNEDDLFYIEMILIDEKIKGNNNPQNEIAENSNQMDKDNNIENLQLLDKTFSKHIGEKRMHESKNKKVLEDTSDDITTNS
ncbi:hypothetical protein ACFE04_011306 [Oxalis oulophora]